MVRGRRLSHKDPRRFPRVSRFRQGIRRRGGFRTRPLQSGPPLWSKGRIRNPKRRRFRGGILERRGIAGRKFRCRGSRYLRRGLFENGFRRFRPRPREIPLTFGNPARAFAFGVHRVRAVVFGIVRAFASFDQILRQGRTSSFRRRDHVHALLNHLTRGIRPFGPHRFRKRFGNFGIPGQTRSRRFEKLRSMGQRPLRRPRFRRRERIEKRARKVLSPPFRGNPADARGSFARHEGRHRFQGRAPFDGQASLLRHSDYALRTAAGRRIRHRLRRGYRRSLAGNLRIQTRARALRHVRIARRRRRHVRFQPPGVLVVGKGGMKSFGEAVFFHAVTSFGHFNFA